MKKRHIALITFAILVIPYFLGGYSLLYRSVFGVAQRDVERRIYEQSKSRVHGLVEQLAKYKYEYDRSTSAADKEAIVQVIRATMATLDANDVEPVLLRQFLINTRGY